MVTRCVRMPEHDLTLRLVSGEHTSADALEFYRRLDSSCATRWLSYFDHTVSMASIDVASMPEMKRVMDGKLKELFGDRPKPYAVVLQSESANASFRFWRHYANSENMQCFRHLEDACGWLELSPAARAAVGRAIRDWEMARAVDAWEVDDGCSEPLKDPMTSGGFDASEAELSEFLRARGTEPPHLAPFGGEAPQVADPVWSPVG